VVDPVSVEDSEVVPLEDSHQEEEVALEEDQASVEDLDSEEVMVALLEDKSSDMSTSTLPQMKHQAPKPELSEFQEEETST
jgi:hypothetical protein